MALPESITLNGTPYTTATLPEAARSQVQNIQVVEAEIVRLQQQLGIAQTARNVYIQALSKAMNSPVADAPVTPAPDTPVQ